MFNATFNYISVISSRSVLLVEETGIPKGRHKSLTNLSHDVVSSTPRHEWGSNSQLMHGTNMEHPFTGKSWRTKHLNIVYYMRKKIYLWGSFYSIFSFMCMFWFCRSLCVLLYFFFIWSLCCLFFFDLRILIIPLVSSNYSFAVHMFFFWHQINIHKFLRIWCFRTTKSI